MAVKASYTVSLANMGEAIADILSEFGKQCDKGIEKAVKTTADKGKEIVHNKAKGYGWDRYPDSIDDKKIGVKAYKIYAKRPVGSLAHLLDKGHRVVVSGVVYGRSPAFPHLISSVPEVEEIFIDELIKNIERSVY